MYDLSIVVPVQRSTLETIAQIRSLYKFLIRLQQNPHLQNAQHSTVILPSTRTQPAPNNLVGDQASIRITWLSQVAKLKCAEQDCIKKYIGRNQVYVPGNTPSYNGRAD